VKASQMLDFASPQVGIVDGIMATDAP